MGYRRAPASLQSSCKQSFRNTSPLAVGVTKPETLALDPTTPILPPRPGLPEKRSHDYVRHGTRTLFAALEIATGKVHRRVYATAPAPGVALFLSYFSEPRGAVFSRGSSSRSPKPTRVAELKDA